MNAENSPRESSQQTIVSRQHRKNSTQLQSIPLHQINSQKELTKPVEEPFAAKFRQYKFRDLKGETRLAIKNVELSKKKGIRDR